MRFIFVADPQQTPISDPATVDISKSNRGIGCKGIGSGFRHPAKEFRNFTMNTFGSVISTTQHGLAS